ncbi:MAG: FtsX-like permease family protein [Terriglobales bacterium]|jgi:putative ABC transport system permease protein
MTLTRFVTKSAFRNKRRSILTVLSIAFSLLLLTLMMTIWRAFYLDTFSAQSAQRLITRHRVSLTESLPLFYREKIRAIPGVVAVAPNNWFGGIYKDAKPENMFAQFGTDPDEILKIFTDFRMPADQLLAWQRDRAGAIVDGQLAKKYGWKLGDRIVLKGTIYPVDLELTIRGIYTAPEPTSSVYYNQKYVEEAVSFAKGTAGIFCILTDSPSSVATVASAVDNMFRNSPEPTKTESEKAFQLDFINSIGNVKAFILSICFAVAFATLLVSANTMAMSIRERTREVAVLKTLGFTRQSILGLYIGEAVLVALTGGALGCLLALVVVSGMSHAPGIGMFLAGMRVKFPTLLLAIFVAGMVGFLSAILPAYHAAKLDIVEGLRYIG